MATRLQSYLTPMPSFSGSEWNNRSQWGSMPKTADQRVLNQTYLRSKAAHDLLMQAQAQEAEIDNEILNTATPDEMANLFGQPRTEREARLQQIVQKDVNARERGVRLIPNEKQKVAYAQSLENLKRSRLANYLDPLQFELEQAKFAEVQDKNFRDWVNQGAIREFQNRNLDATQQYRDMQRQNAESNRMQRERFNQSGYNQRQRFHDDSVANQQLQAMFEMERMLQAKADEEQRQQNVEANSLRRYFGDVAAAANAGAITPEQMSQFQSRFDPATMAILKGYAGIGARQNALLGVPPTTSAPSTSILDRMRNMPTIPLPGVGIPIRNPFSGSPAVSPETQAALNGEWPDDNGEDESFDMGGSEFAPPPPMAARPSPAQAPQRGGFTPGQIVRNRRTGQVFRVGANGQLQPVR